MSRGEAVNAREIAGKLTKASKRALPHLGEDWSSGDRPHVVLLGAYSLGWGNDAGFRLIERRWTEQRALEVRLTPLGLEVRAVLQEGGS
jgi:hypothetical protein